MSSATVVSVVVPVYNDATGLRETLRSVVSQTVSSGVYEVLVVDNGSTDATPEVIETFAERYPDLVVGLEEREVQSSYAARNTGIERARGEIIAFLDADMTVDETWVRDVRDAFDRSDVDYLGYEVDLYLPDGKASVWGRYDVATGLPVGHYLRTKRFAPTCALAVRADVFDAVGRFDDSLVSGGDREFGRRIYEAGFEMRFEDAITVRHPARTTFRAHLQKARRIGRGQVQLWARHGLAPHPLSPFRWVPPNPARLGGRVGGDADSFVAFYLLSYLFKLVQAVTALRMWASSPSPASSTL